MRDNVNKLGQVLFGPPATNLPAWTTSFTGQTIDLSAQPGFNAATLYLIAGTWTDGTHAFSIQEAPDVAGSPGAWTAVAATDLSRLETANPSGGLPITQSATMGSQPASISSAATALSQRVGYLGGQRFVRVVGTLSGTTSGAKYLPVWILGEPRVLPAAV